MCIIITFFVCSCLRTVKGEVVEGFANAEIGGVSFVIQKPSGEKLGFLFTDETSVKSETDNISSREFKDNLPCYVTVTVRYSDVSKSLTDSEGNEIKAYNAYEIVITGVTDGFFNAT